MYYVSQGQASDAGDGISRLEIVKVQEDEGRIVLKTTSGEVFSITYQTDYPSSSDEYLVSFYGLFSLTVEVCQPVRLGLCP